MSGEWQKQAERIAELGNNRASRAYLLGRLCELSTAEELAALVEGALVFSERFDSPGDDSRAACVQAVRHLEQCDACAQVILHVCAVTISEKWNL